MFVSGFTIVRNAVKYDYPVVESICSVLPLVDELIVLVGNSDDNTLGLIERIDSAKIKIHHSKWDDNLRKGGAVLAAETNKAFKLINRNADWAFYLQADEVLHEQDYTEIRYAMQQNLKLNKVDGLLFKYIHFFGSYNYVADSRSFYRSEIRIIRNNPEICSYKDAQGFRKNGQKLTVKLINACVFHYGWVRHPQVMSSKIKDFHKLWHSDDWINAQHQLNNNFNYNNIDAVALFKGMHPAVMNERISNKNWDFKPNLNTKKLSFKNKFLYWIEKNTGYRIGEYKNYKLLKK